MRVFDLSTIPINMKIIKSFTRICAFSVGTILLFALSCKQVDIENKPVEPPIISTDVSIINNETASPIGNISKYSGNDISERGFCWNTKQNPTKQDSTSKFGTGVGVFKGVISKLKAGTVYFLRAYVITSVDIFYGNEITFRTPDYLVDIDGNVCKTVNIGNQIWMAENLKTTKYNDSNFIPNVTDSIKWMNLTTGAYCNYRNDDANGSKYGRLYNWYSLTSGKLAPQGWHIASDSEWTILENYLISKGYDYDGSATSSTNSLAKTLSDISGWKSSGNLGSPGNDMFSNNSSGFSAIPCGERYQGVFTRLGSFAFWWCYDETNTWYRDIQYNGVFIYRSNTRDKSSGTSVRCIKD